MSVRPPHPRQPTRRRVLGWFGALPLVSPDPALAQSLDQGIGGTGARPPDTPGEEGDRGIGGTGVIGTIRRFGSIVVNDLRITYPTDVAVRIDGRPATTSDLKVGHVVRVVARGSDGALSTQRIDVTSEVVGPVEAVARGRLLVLGQRVSVAAAEVARWKVGDRVAVSGLRRPDGVIVASLIEPRLGGPTQVSGPVRRGPDGTATIGALRLNGIRPDLNGRRAAVTGEPAGAVLKVSNSEEAPALFLPGLKRLSIESYVGRRGDRLNLGSGYAVAGAPDPLLPRRGSVRAVVTTDVSRDGILTVESLRIDDRIDQRGQNGLQDGTFGRSGRDAVPGRGNPGQGNPGHGLPGRSDRPGGLERPGGARSLDIDTRMPGAGPGGFGQGGPNGGQTQPGGFGGPGPSPGGNAPPGGFGSGGGGPPGGGFGGNPGSRGR